MKKDRFSLATFAAQPQLLCGIDCRINLFQKSLSDKERASFKNALFDPTISISAVFKVAQQFGYKGATTALYNHRREPGACQRCNKSKFIPRKT